MLLSLDMYQTVAVAVLVLLLGSFLKKRIYFLEKFCIPAPVIKVDGLDYLVGKTAVFKNLLCVALGT